jgi:DNA-binding transcriptional MerR regulator
MREWLGPAEMAARLGVSVKALRVYERAGLVMPDRTAANYRRYGPAHAARLHQVLALNRLGLPLAKIAGLLAGRLASLDSVLALQQQVLETRATELREALAAIGSARARLEAGVDLSLDDLVTLTRKSVMTMKSDEAMAAALKPAVDRHFSAEEQQALAANAPYFDQEQVSREWEALIAEAKALAAKGDPASPEAKDLARRWFAQIDRFTGGDPDVAARLGRVWSDSMQDPAAAKALPLTPELMAFVGAARRAAGREGA